jgi:hypothetical protein
MRTEQERETVVRKLRICGIKRTRRGTKEEEIRRGAMAVNIVAGCVVCDVRMTSVFPPEFPTRQVGSNILLLLASAVQIST